MDSLASLVSFPGGGVPFFTAANPNHCQTTESWFDLGFHSLQRKKKILPCPTLQVRPTMTVPFGQVLQCTWAWAKCGQKCEGEDLDDCNCPNQNRFQVIQSDLFGMVKWPLLGLLRGHFESPCGSWICQNGIITLHVSVQNTDFLAKKMMWYMWFFPAQGLMDVFSWKCVANPYVIEALCRGEFHGQHKTANLQHSSNVSKKWSYTHPHRGAG